MVSDKLTKWFVHQAFQSRSNLCVFGSLSVATTSQQDQSLVSQSMGYAPFILVLLVLGDNDDD
jgi:hypothetical protein